MNIQSTLRGLRTAAFGAIAGVAVFIPAQVNAATHFVGGGGFHGGFHSGFGGYRGGYAYGLRGGYGYGYGYRRGYGCCGWGWPGGLFLATLPLYYSTWWWGGVPYYYAYNNYYVWNPDVAQYQSVAPPSGMLTQGAPGAEAARGTDLFAYPKNGQSQEQQARDRQECRDWAATQTGSSAPAQGGLETNLRAQAACLEGRGYSVK
jgi:hypothetical protein